LWLLVVHADGIDNALLGHPFLIDIKALKQRLVLGHGSLGLLVGKFAGIGDGGICQGFSETPEPEQTYELT